MSYNSSDPFGDQHGGGGSSNRYYGGSSNTYGNSHSSPFSDPAISHAMNSSGGAAHHTVDVSLQDEDDLSGNYYSRSNRSRQHSGNSTASNVGNDARRGYLDGSNAAASTPGHATIDMSDRERDLQQREQDLAARERQLREQQAAMGTAGARPANNFPPFYPVMYHNIDAEIPVHEQKTVRYLFRSWLILEATVVFNLISCFVLMVSHIEQNWTGTTDFGVSFTYLFTATFGSFFLWYRPVYNAYMKEKSLYYFIYFVFGGLHILFSAYMAAGFYGSGSAGLINTINALSHSAWAAGVFGIINSAAWICQVLFHLYMYKRVYTHYRTQGHTFADAKAQAIGGIAQSNVAQQAAQQAATTAATSYLSGTAGGRT